MMIVKQLKLRLKHRLKTKIQSAGKQIIDKGWRVLFDSEKAVTYFLTETNESGPTPSLMKNLQLTKTIFRSNALGMETAGKQVDNEEMRELMKENGIGRPSTRRVL